MKNFTVGQTVWVLDGYCNSIKQHVVEEVETGFVRLVSKFYSVPNRFAFSSEADAIAALLERARKNVAKAEGALEIARRALARLEKKYGEGK